MSSRSFKLTPTELDGAKAAIAHHGYSTMLPMPIEWQHLEDHWEAIRYHLSRLDLETYDPCRSITVIAAKSGTTTRTVHLLHPEDLLLYTALTLLIKDDIEAHRIPRTAQRVYSYRASSLTTELYGTTQHSHDAYLDRLERKAKRTKTNFIGVTDIANFYPSLSQKMLQQILLKATRRQRSRSAAMLLLSRFAGPIMPHDGRGIPTGPFASRVLAEALLDDIDRYLNKVGVDFVRWVDDFNIFSSSFDGAREAILELSEWLYREHGLSLQSAKTHIYDVDTYSRRFLPTLDQLLENRGALPALFGELDYDDLDYVMEDVEAIALLETIVNAIRQSELVDYRLVRFTARRLSKMSLDREIADDLLDVLIENLNRLWPAAEDVAKLISALLPRSVASRKHARRLLRAVSGMGAIDHQAVWILTVFAQDKDCWGCAGELTTILSGCGSDAIRYYGALAMAHLNGQSHEPGSFLRQGRWRGWR